MYRLLANVGKAFATLSHMISSLGTIGMMGEIEPPKSLLD